MGILLRPVLQSEDIHKYPTTATTDITGTICQNFTKNIPADQYTLQHNLCSHIFRYYYTDNSLDTNWLIFGWYF
jgi:hypothetical protein